MAFWIAAVALTAFAVAAVLLPMVRRGKATDAGAAAYDQEVYKAQLAELERDVEQGTLSPAEAEASRVEISRRLLAADRAAETQDTSQGAGGGKSALIAIALFVPVFAIGLYAIHGAPALPGQPFAERKDPEGPANLQSMIQRLARQLEENPDNVEGWGLLARSYMATGHFDKAAKAFEKALGLDAGNVNLRSAYGEALFLKAGEVVTPAALAAFKSVLEKAPKEPRARYYIAMADLQAGKAKQAFAEFKAIVDEAPPGAPYLPTVVAQANKIAERIGAEKLPEPAPPAAVAGMPPNHPPTNPPTGAPGRPGGAAPESAPGTAPTRGPTREQMEAAAQMTPEQRMEMIKGMVQGLSERLKDQPNDLNGWMRLANAYRVLNEPQKRADALAQAAALAPKNNEVLLLYGRALRTAAKERQTLQSVAVMRQVLANDPNNMEALFLVGRAEASAGKIAEGKAKMQKVLEMMPPNSPDRALLQKEIESLGK
jgi:cytochrome c-type biogenesis protein CcmH